MSEDSIIEQIINGDYNSSTLNTALGTRATKWDFIKAIGLPFYSRILFENPTALGIVFGSAIAKELILDSSTCALVIAASENATKNIFASKDMAKEIITNRIWLDAYRQFYLNYQRLKRQINASGSKLKQGIYDTSGTHTLAVSGMVAYSTAILGGGAYTYTNGANTYTGQGGELATKTDLLTLTGNIDIVVGVAGNVSSSAGGESSVKYNSGANTILTADGGQGSPSAGNVGAGATTGGGINSMYDKDLFAPWQVSNISNIGGGSVIFSGVDEKQGGLGGSYYTQYGKGQSSTQTASPSTAGLVVFNYIAD